MTFTTRSLLCPVDLSDHSRVALEYAVAWAHRFEATLTLLSINEPILVKAATATYGPDYLAHKSAGLLRDFHAGSVSVGTTWVTDPQLVVREGHPADEILAVARERGADLVIMGTHGLGGYRKLFFGSTTEKVLQETSVPVIAVPMSEHPLVSLDAEGPTFDLERLLVPVDFETATRADVQVAVDLGTALDVPLLLLHVVTPAHADQHWRTALEAEDRIRVAEAKDRMATLATEVGTPGRLETHVAVGRVADEIAATAAERHARLVVMGLRGGGGLMGPHTGAIAYRVLCMAPAPVLVLPTVEPAT